MEKTLYKIQKNNAYISESIYTQSIKNCRNKLSVLHLDIDAVFAPSRGGLYPGVWMSHQFKCPLSVITFKDTIVVDIPSTNNKIALLCDDISDSGSTLIKCTKFLEKYYEKIITCTIVIKEDTKVIPDVYEIVVPKEYWVVFPYEKE
jgi:hypoxanthine phosphoribosyltransferase